MIFITGGSGLIGSFLIAQLLREGKAVKALYRDRIPAQLPRDTRVEWIKGDILDTFLLRQVIQEAEVVYHCAGLVSYADQDAELLKEINIQGTANVVDACLEKPGIRLVHVSSIAAIGASKGQTVLNESAKWDPAAPHSLYASSKYLGELEVWRGISEGLRAVIVNPSVILGPAYNWSRSSTQLFKYVADEKRFYTRGSANFVDVRDVVRCMTELAEKDEALGQRFILNAGTMAYQDFFKLVAQHLGTKAPSVRVPAWLTGVVWRAERVRTFLTGGKPLITRDTARITQRPYTYSSVKVQELVPGAFRPLPDTIAWCCQEIITQRGFKAEPGAGQSLLV